ncbi:unnamed protein product, partial [Coregonus sp. 'balchen']
MDPSKEESASEKERKPAVEESEEPSSTSSRMWTRSREKCRDLEAEISRMKVKLEVLKRMLAVPVLLLTALEEMNPHELKTFQSFLTSGLLPDCPPIPESQLQNADRQVTVDQMVKTYGPERARMLAVPALLLTTLEELTGEQLKTFQFKLTSVQLLGFPPIPETLLLATLEELTEEQLKTFQSNLTSGWMLVFPPIPESQLENADRQDTVDQMVKRYGPEGAVEITLRILRRMMLRDLAEKLETDHRGGTASTSHLSLFPPRPRSVLSPVWLPPISPLLSRSSSFGSSMNSLWLTSPGSSGQLRSQRPSMLDVPALLLTTLEELTEEQLKTFQSYLTIGWMLGFPLLPECQLENADRQDTVDQMVKRYGPERAVKITLNTMRKMDLGDLAEKLERDHRGEPQILLFSWNPMNPIVGQAFTLPSATDGTMEEESQDCVRVHLSDSLPEAMDELIITECRVVDQSLCTTDPPMRSPENFEPEIYNHEGKGAYRFQCPSAGLFQCSITGLVFRMEGEGEVLYRTVPWDRRLLAQRGKRPAGPLFNIDCPLKSVCQLHLPHCQIHSDTHVIINITGFSAYGDVTDDDAPISPIHGLVLLFHQLFVPEERSILNVLLLPRNVVIREVQDERKRRNGYKETFIETTPHCNLTPNKPYILSTNITHGYRINPTAAAFVDFQSDENYFSTFQLFLETIVKEVELLLKEKEGDELVWNRLVWLPGTTTNVSNLLLGTLAELVSKELERFQWHLSQGDEAPISPIQGLVLLFHQLFVPEERSILNVLLLPSNVVIRE